jgi:hypothetical protein
MAVSTPAWSVSSITFSAAFSSALFTRSVAPNFFAISSRLSSISIMMIDAGE